MSNRETVQCSSSHMDVGKNLFSFTDYSKKAIKTQDQSYPISRWFSRSSKLQSNITELVISMIAFSEKKVFADIIIAINLHLKCDIQRRFWITQQTFFCSKSTKGIKYVQS